MVEMFPNQTFAHAPQFNWLNPNAPCVNSLWPSDAIWWHRSRSAMAQVMAWCLMASSHYLNHCWCTISNIQWHSYNIYYPVHIFIVCYTSWAQMGIYFFLSIRIYRWNYLWFITVMCLLSWDESWSCFYGYHPALCDCDPDDVICFFTDSMRVVYGTYIINSLAPGRCGCNFKMLFSDSFNELIPYHAYVLPVKLLSDECHKTPLMISQHWFM